MVLPAIISTRYLFDCVFSFSCQSLLLSTTVLNDTYIQYHGNPNEPDCLCSYFESCILQNLLFVVLLVCYTHLYRSRIMQWNMGFNMPSLLLLVSR